MRLDINKQFSTTSDRVKGIDFHPSEPWVLTTLYSGKIEIYNYETGAKVKSITVTDVPVRAGKFIARKNWVVVGSDDYQVRVYNYNTSEKVAQFEAHPDYIRSIAVHPTKPYVLTSSDDMTIRLWNWDSNWKNEQTFEGHQHYVMSIAFNPKDPNTFASACLDKTVKIWSLGTNVPNFTLLAHEAKGVNYVEYYPQSDKPYLITASDDKTVKIWDYQTKSNVATLEGHISNVSFAIFHPELPLIVSGSEDGTIKVWNANTYKLEKSLNYGLERAWCIAFRRHSNLIAVGYDSGNVVVKLGSEEPALSMDSMGKIVYAKQSEIYQTVVKSTETKDGEIIPLSQKELGSVEVFPTTLKHSPNGRFIAVTGDSEYNIYTALAWRSKAYGSALDFVWAQDANSNLFAIRESPSAVKIFKNFTERLSNPVQLVYTADKIFGGALLAVKSEGFVSFFDWDSGMLVRRVDVEATDVVWSDNGELVAIVCADQVYVLKFNRDAFVECVESGEHDPEEGIEDAFEVQYDVTDVVASGKWIGDVFLYTSTNMRLNYLVGGEIINVAHSDKSMYLLGYLPRDNKVYITDKDLNVVSYYLSLSVLEFQTLVLRGDLSESEKEPSELTSGDLDESISGLLAKIAKADMGKIARFLEKQDYTTLALELTTDNEQKFELSVAMNDLAQAFEIAKIDDAEPKWKKLGDVALKNWNVKLAADCYDKANDFASLLLIHTSTNNQEALNNLAEKAVANGHYNVAFNCYWTMGDLGKATQLLKLNNRLPEAAIVGLTYGLEATQLNALVKDWEADLNKSGKSHVSARLANPVDDAAKFPQQANLIDIGPGNEAKEEVEEEVEVEAGEEAEEEVETEETEATRYAPVSSSTRCYSKKKGASSSRWLERSRNDHHTKEARIAGYKSRAAFKLLSLHAKYQLFKTDPSRPQAIVDLGFAPGAWSQVAVQATQGTGNVLGVDILNTRPPQGASSMQGNILSKHTHEQIRTFFIEEDPIIQGLVRNTPDKRDETASLEVVEAEEDIRTVSVDGEDRIVVDEDITSYYVKEAAKIHQEEEIEEALKKLSLENTETSKPPIETTQKSPAKMSINQQFPVDLVISDMCAPVPQPQGAWNNTTNMPMYRLANTTGILFKDHLSSMDLCDAALILCIDLLRSGGNFVCKFYTGKEDGLLEKRLKRVFKRVIREKPVASNAESKEYYFVCLGKKPGATKIDVFS
ncbi:hypothetical protein BABINDRAFT_9627 [Babjeviella inositovora NRRL Y-12698]|uniref:Beta'-coat protein n=1 Tax=Babjeviella inositovora NRRL Y-12698 TaxID=984486 RepID=A0A1E3QK41_9ASCO|nr:uncharacterized protein BABINDRAFT_9627 [Babjeviella inositovora NRRL Y-12698]ODQ78020.1 hypothetical protein BABINDRAFT_9627 [Babjeviella inositovora NRRL Y-12698]